MRAVIYARFSTDKQDFSSIADQYRVCEQFAARHGWQITSRYSDEGISGAAIGNRPGFKAMMAAAEAGEFDVLLVMELSRLARSAGDLNKTIDRLTFRDVRVIGVSNGYDSARKGHKLQAGVEGVMGEAFRDLVRDKTYTALHGRAERGARAGGLSFGYRSIEVDGARRLEVVLDQAQVIREIFEMFARGMSPRAIAHELNLRRVLSPRGGTWAVSAIHGDRKRSGVGILNNPLYIGRVIWNRSEWVKDPDSGKRKRKERPESEWIVREDESLRIVPQELWDAARRRMSTPTARGGSHGRGRGPRALLSGVLRCGECGGPMIAVSANTYGCANRKDRGPSVCTGFNVRRAETELALVDSLREGLFSPVALAQLHTDAREMLRAKRAAVEETQFEVRRRLVQVETELSNIVSAIKAGAYSPVLQAELAKLEAERDRLRTAMARTESARDPVEEIPDLLKRYRRMVEELKGALAREPEQARTIVAESLGEVVLVREGKKIFAEFDDPSERLLIAASGESPNMVAGARFGLPCLSPKNGESGFGDTQPAIGQQSCGRSAHALPDGCDMLPRQY
jgi:DNA invertase Pin-like site-specific DNA recombinase